MAGHVARMLMRILVAEPEGRTRRRWVENIKIDVREDWDQWRAHVNMVINLRVP
jgi:hypothetical protein